MTVSPVSAEPEAFAVRPVVDYEPAPQDVTRCRQLSATALRRPTTHSPQHGAGHRPSPRQVPSMSPWMRQAAIFADAAIRRVLEVMDRRRPASQLQGLLAVGLADSVLAAHRVAASRLVADGGAAVLRRLRLQPIRAGERAAAEVFGTYSRGRRVHAIACRVELGVPPACGGTPESRWQVVALHIG
ncbi:Rv3235 family protein [Mycobacterium shimoidei]|uniref:Uncharacterized protein n=1 Tax=Mycobacterium shimoidei TaxID=29313 RepID=A0A1E3TET6_MYCSH|nr:Rv3235 family protein [Mycobacterium shimoidei]MCV7260194.1 hypothetical protein [Mycobacterium shimoidei]ODR12911.1 hypothetical protein BHQ16_13590 [Mycobacterium shimoidei]SRX96362.1 hypothetical protein MSP7336_04640 [Mycobacterium shimoidei]